MTIITPKSMKKYFISILVSTVFFSCVSVAFTDPQPSDVKNLTSFPSSFQGTFYSNENDTFRIGATFYKVINTNDQSFFNGEEQKEVPLSDSLLLRKYGNLYCLNVKEDENWSVCVLKQLKDKSISVGFLTGSSEELTKKLDFIQNKKIIRDEEGKVDKFILTPTKKEFKLLIKKKYFEKSLVLKKIN